MCGESRTPCTLKSSEMAQTSKAFAPHAPRRMRREKGQQLAASSQLRRFLVRQAASAEMRHGPRTADTV